MTPSQNRTLDAGILGMNVGLCANDTRLEVCVDFSNETEASVGFTALTMYAHEHMYVHMTSFMNEPATSSRF